MHASRYYSLDVSIFKTSLDSSIINLLWNKYWVNTLAASPLLSNKAFLGGQLEDVSALPPIPSLRHRRVFACVTTSSAVS